VLPALLLIMLMGFFTAVVRAILVSRIQDELTDDVRATMLSMQSLTFTLVAAISQPSLGAIADRWGLSAAYVALAGALSFAIVLFFWKSRQHFLQAARAICPPQLLEPLEQAAE